MPEVTLTKADVRKRIGRATILGIASDIHSGINGSLERYGDDIIKDIALLEDVLATWEPSQNQRYAAFDDAVRHVVVCAIAEGMQWAKERQVAP